MTTAVPKPISTSGKTDVRVERGSFRDRTNRVVYHNGQVYRLLRGRGVENWKTLQTTPFFEKGVAEGDIVETLETGNGTLGSEIASQHWDTALGHAKIPFISYPYEWSYGMLQDAALLQLKLLERALEEGMIIKDSSPYNVQFIGSKPTFIDISSFEPVLPGAVWVGYRQFCELFLYPLMLQAYRNVPFQQMLKGDLEGMSPQNFNGLMSFRDMFRPGVFKHVYLHSKLQRAMGDTKRNVKGELAKAGFHTELILANVRGLQKLVKGLRWKESSSQWSDYADDCISYNETNLAAKISFIENVIKGRRYRMAWDLGCNTGNFCRLALQSSDFVVGMDYDHLAIERLYQKLKEENCRTILPLVGNLANTSAGIGWRGLERKRLEERGSPDLTMALALIHHIVLTANIPLDEFVEWLASLGPELIIEFVDRNDPMVEKLLRNKIDQYDEYTLANFEQIMSRYYRVEKKEVSPSKTRVMFYGKRI